MLESLFNKVARAEDLELYEEETSTQVFSCEIFEIFKNSGAMRKRLKNQSFADILQNRCSSK